MKRIERTTYLNQLKDLQDKQIIKVITGVRRCGKSTLMEIYQDYLRNNGVQENQIIVINFEDFDNFELRDSQKLYQYVKDRILDDNMTYVFFDEIQLVDRFPDVVNSLFLKKNVDLYLTGSNAYMLSSEIATLLSGRYVEIPLLPLSFKEYISFDGDTSNLQRKYSEYIEFSSFPYILDLEKNIKIIDDYLHGIYSTIVLKDIITRKKINDVMLLESVIRFVFDNIGNVLSSKKIADTLTSSGRKTDVKTIEKYINAMLESFVIYQANRYNIKGKQFLKTMEKYYVVDLGLRAMLLGRRSYDVGHILENIVYLELLRRGKEVYIGKVDDLEVDFVTIDRDTIAYYQVAATVRDENTLKRELLSLQKIKDQYPKVLLTLDEDPDADYNGIKRVNVLNWLLSE
ncbi:MAG: ATP-binding protein [Clostridia bacterium]|nr:ATP-binding protein [Clostridia bacterium]